MNELLVHFCNFQILMLVINRIQTLLYSLRDNNFYYSFTTVLNWVSLKSSIIQSENRELQYDNVEFWC